MTLTTILIGSLLLVAYASYAYWRLRSLRRTLKSSDKKNENSSHVYEHIIELGVTLLAIMAPFALLYISLEGQAESQRQYEKEKLIQMLAGVQGEALNNQKFTQDGAMYPAVVDTTGGIAFFRPRYRFHRRAWETISSQDYFYTVDLVTIYNCRNFYSLCDEGNRIIDSYIKSVELANEMIGNTTTTVPGVNAAAKKISTTYVQAAKPIFKEIGVAAGNVSKSIQRELDRLRGSK